MNEPLPHLKGRRCLCLVRCSTHQQADTSIPDQLKLLKAFIQQHQMVHVDDIILDGISGSRPGARTDVAEILERKKTRNDFDILLLQDISRLTRGGTKHGMKLQYDFNAVGIELIFANNPQPEGEHTSIIQSFDLYAAQQYAKSLSFAVARGSMSSLEQGRMTHCLMAPYGIDRLFISNDGQPLHVIRNMADGTQQKLDPKTGELLGTFAAETGHGRTNHYRMQANERVVLIPGEPSRVDAVRLMFRLRLVNGWAGFRIARELDRLGIPAMKGGRWCVSTINKLLLNPVYTGVGLANRYTQAIYHTRQTNTPKPSTIDRSQLANRARPAMQTRPKEDWLEIDYPLLKDYLGDLREPAIRWQQEQLSKTDKGHIPKPVSRDRHADSAYILKGLLKSKQGQHPMSGRRVGNPSRRYYAVHRGFTVPQQSKLLRRHVAADLVESAVLDVVKDVLLQTPDLKERLVQIIESQHQQQQDDQQDIKELETQKQQLQQKMELAIDALGAVGQDAIKSKLQKLESQLANVVDRLKKATAAPVRQDANNLADQMLQTLRNLGENLNQLPTHALRQLLGSLIGKLEGDLETKALEIELKLPDWATIEKISLATTSVQKCSYEAYADIPLETAICRYKRVGRIPCMTCTRTKRAA